MLDLKQMSGTLASDGLWDTHTNEEAASHIGKLNFNYRISPLDGDCKNEA